MWYHVHFCLLNSLQLRQCKWNSLRTCTVFVNFCVQHVRSSSTPELRHPCNENIGNHFFTIWFYNSVYCFFKYQIWYLNCVRFPIESLFLSHTVCNWTVHFILLYKERRESFQKFFFSLDPAVVGTLGVCVFQDFPSQIRIFFPFCVYARKFSIWENRACSSSNIQRHSAAFSEKRDGWKSSRDRFLFCLFHSLLFYSW